MASKLKLEVDTIKLSDFNTFQENDLIRENLQFNGNNKQINDTLKLIDVESNKLIKIKNY